jgi:hypothetical protein
MSFFSNTFDKLCTAINDIKSDFERIEKEEQERAFNAGYNDYNNNNSRCYNLMSPYSERELLNRLYKKGREKAREEKYPPTAGSGSYEDVITHRNRSGRITGTSTRRRR